MENNERKETPQKGLWKIIDSIEGDKVIWIIVLLLILISVLAIFSSTSMIKNETRIDIMTEHTVVAICGLALIFIMYKWVKWIGLYRVLSQLGFAVSFVLLLILDSGIDLGFIKSETINGATRTLGFMGKQIHVFEIVKVAMVMYLAWALHSYKQDKEAMEEGVESSCFKTANRLAEKENFAFMKKPFWKRVFYIYAPTLVVCAMVAYGSNSSAIFIGLVLIGTMMIGGIPLKELMLPIMSLVVVALMIFGIYKVSGGELMPRVGTFMSRLSADYDAKKLRDYKEGTKEFYEVLDPMRQPYGALVAIHEGGIIGKGSGNSTQKYSVPHIYSDYMFSFLIEEYGLVGGFFIILLYISLIARSSMIARLCGNEFAKIAVGGLALLITGQAFMHMLVNVGLGPMTGQTLPLVSHGSSAFLVFCVAFGIILSISRMAKKKMQTMEEHVVKNTDDIQERINILEQIDDKVIS